MAKKSDADAILAFAKAKRDKKKPEEVEEVEYDASEELELLGSKALKAIEKGDAKALAKAVQALVATSGDE